MWGIPHLIGLVALLANHSTSVCPGLLYSGLDFELLLFLPQGPSFIPVLGLVSAGVPQHTASNGVRRPSTHSLCVDAL
jgi:hypothetical protein